MYLSRSPRSVAILFQVWTTYYGLTNIFVYAWDLNHNSLEVDVSNEHNPSDPRRSFLFPRAADVRYGSSQLDPYPLQETELQETESDDPNMLEFLLAGPEGYDSRSSPYLQDLLSTYSEGSDEDDEYINYYPGEEYNVYPNANQGIVNSLNAISTEPTSSLTSQSILGRPALSSSSTSPLPAAHAPSHSGSAAIRLPSHNWNSMSFHEEFITAKHSAYSTLFAGAPSQSSSTTSRSSATNTISRVSTTASSAANTISSVATTTSRATTEGQSTKSETTYLTSNSRASATTPSLTVSVPSPSPSSKKPDEDEDENPPSEDPPAEPPAKPIPDPAGAAGGAAGAAAGAAGGVAGGAAGAAGGLFGDLGSLAGAAGAVGVAGAGAAAGVLAGHAGGQGGGNSKIQSSSSSTPAIHLLAEGVTSTGHSSTPSKSLATYATRSSTSTGGPLPNTTPSSPMSPSTSATVTTATSAPHLRNGAHAVILPPPPLASIPGIQPSVVLSSPSGPPIVLAGLRSAAALLALPIPLTRNYAANAPPHSNPPHAQLPQCNSPSPPSYAPAAPIASNATITTACSIALNATAFDALIDAIYADVQAKLLPPFPYKVPWIYVKETSGVRWNYTTVGPGGSESVFLGTLDYFNYLRYAGWANAGVGSVSATGVEISTNVRRVIGEGARVADVEVCEVAGSVGGCLGRGGRAGRGSVRM
ncbi:hypothetical protein MMC27_007872 [Xylographa pallens]|nr:hypothetical protein [Xylographa pallens]